MGEPLENWEDLFSNLVFRKVLTDRDQALEQRSLRFEHFILKTHRQVIPNEVISHVLPKIALFGERL